MQISIVYALYISPILLYQVRELRAECDNLLRAIFKIFDVCTHIHIFIYIYT